MPRRAKGKAVQGFGVVAGLCGALKRGALLASRLRVSTEKGLREGGGESREDGVGLLKKAPSSPVF